MDEQKVYWSEVDKFSALMRKELDANTYKAHWLDLPPQYLLMELQEHMDKLEMAVENDDAHDILEFGADVGNIAMMIVDRTVGLRECGHRTILKGDSTGRWKMAVNVMCTRPAKHDGKHGDGFSEWDQ